MKLDATNRDLFLTSDNRRNPKLLWESIELEYASKKARNRSRLFTRFLLLNCSDGNLAKYVSAFREITREMTDSGVNLDDDLLAHMALHHLPAEHKTTRQVVIATSESSNIALSLSGVLSQMNELICDGTTVNHSANALVSHFKTPNQRSNTYERCTKGRHNPKTAHSDESCWQLHPNKSPHNNPKTSANVATISGRALCARASRGVKTDKSILDSGSSHHMFKDQKHFSDHNSQETTIEVANGETMTGQGICTVSASHKGAPLSFGNTLHVPDLKCNLVSLVQLAKNGCSLTFKDGGRFEVTQDDEIALSGTIVDGLMELDLELGTSSLPNPCAYTVVTDSVLLHSRLGHPGRLPFIKAFPNHSPPTLCDPCILSKHHRLPYHGRFPVAKEKLEMIHSDLSGIITPASQGGNRY